MPQKQTLLSPTEFAEIETFIQQQADADTFSGVVLVAQNGIPIFQAAHGFAEQGEKIPNRLQTRFNLGSVTKMFTATAIMQLAERGKLKLTDTVADHLANFPNPRANEITIEQVLIHTAGFDIYWNEAYQARRSQIRTVEAYLELFAEIPLLFTPGERYHYSNSGYVVLGAIVEAAAGVDYYTYLELNIFKPLGMSDTAHDELDRSAPNRATGYTTFNWDGSEHPTYRTNNLYLYGVRGSPSTALYSTAADLLKFATAFRNSQILNADSVAQMIQGRIEVGVPNVQYGYGFFILQDKAGHIVSQAGRAMGADAWIYMYWDIPYTLIVLSNYDRPAARQVVNYISNRLMQRGV